MLYFMRFVHELWMRDKLLFLFIIVRGKCNYHCGHRIVFFILNSFLNISSQRGPLCPILLHLLIIRLSIWQSKYDEMHLSIKNAAPTTIGVAKRQSTLNLLYHRAKSRIFCAMFTVDGMVATCPGTCHPEALCNKWVTGSWVRVSQW